jgi:hypothetical protein
MQLVTAEWAKRTGSDPGPTLLTIKDRPVLVIFPSLQEDGSLPSSEHLVEIPVCLATAFFERAALFVNKVEAFWERLGVRKCGPAAMHHRN